MLTRTTERMAKEELVEGDVDILKINIMNIEDEIGKIIGEEGEIPDQDQDNYN